MKEVELRNGSRRAPRSMEEMVTLCTLACCPLFRARSWRSHGFCRMPCLELGLDNWLTCPHLRKNFGRKHQCECLEVLYHTAWSSVLSPLVLFSGRGSPAKTHCEGQQPPLPMLSSLVICAILAHCIFGSFPNVIDLSSQPSSCP